LGEDGENKKFLYIADMTGQAEAYFNYSSNTSFYAMHADVKKMLIKK